MPSANISLDVKHHLWGGMNKRFKQVRMTLNLKSIELARILGVSPQVVSDIETERKDVFKNIIMGMYDNFRINPAWLMAGEGKMFLAVSNSQGLEGINTLSSSGFPKISGGKKIR